MTWTWALLTLACTDRAPVDDTAPADSAPCGGDATVIGFEDGDGDGFGDEGSQVESCDLWPGYVELSGDCDDSDEAVYPGASEEDCADPIDYNCDGSVQYADADGDGFPACEDCDDHNSDIHPEAVEVCDAVDNDCDGELNEDGAVGVADFYADLDADGYGDAGNTWSACEAPSGFVSDATDCDDDDASVYPGAPEICDGKDSDCDGEVGELLVPTDFSTLQQALDAEETEVCLEAGTHTDNTVADLGVDVSITGVDRDTVLLTGDSGRVLEVNLVGSTLRLSSLTVTGGLASDGLAPGVFVVGDGSASFVGRDLLFTGNEADGSSALGVALGLADLSSVELVDVEVTGNTSLGSFGSVFVAYADHVSMDGLSIQGELTSGGEGFADALSVGAATSVQLNDLQVRDNEVVSAFYSCAPVTVYDVGTLDAANLSITGNTREVSADCISAGLFPDVVETTSIRNLEVVGNSCSSSWGTVFASGLYVQADDGRATDSFELINAVIAGNSAEGHDAYGGSMWAFTTAARFENVSVYGNSTTVEGSAYGDWLCSGLSMSLVNVSYGGNTLSSTSTADNSSGFADFWVGCELSQTYTNVYDQGAAPYGDSYSDPSGSDGNISVDPGFVDVSDSDPLNWDLSLDSGSVLIDAGDPGISDPDGSTSDIGAYGGPGAADW
jgi:hypothetical protein